MCCSLYRDLKGLEGGIMRFQNSFINILHADTFEEESPETTLINESFVWTVSTTKLYWVFYRGQHDAATTKLTYCHLMSALTTQSQCHSYRFAIKLKLCVMMPVYLYLRSALASYVIQLCSLAKMLSRHQHGYYPLPEFLLTEML